MWFCSLKPQYLESLASRAQKESVSNEGRKDNAGNNNENDSNTGNLHD